MIPDNISVKRVDKNQDEADDNEEIQLPKWELSKILQGNSIQKNSFIR